MKILRFILFPFSILYGMAVVFHRSLYRWGVLKPKKFDLPLINIGNLSVGGTGKSPHVEYVHQLLASSYQLAILSRGYHRKSKGFRYVLLDSKAAEVGDEPLQFKQKFVETTVAVSEQRALGVQQILHDSPAVNCFILDDAFQHWGIEASVQILLTTFEQPFFEDWVLPMGRLREFRKGYQRADIIIVSKCPPNISLQQKSDVIQKIKPLPHQKVFFSYFKYQTLYPLFEKDKPFELSKLVAENVLVLTGIAQTAYLESYINHHCKSAIYKKYPDHHSYTEANLEALQHLAKERMIITTEKDATKLQAHRDYLTQRGILIYVLAIEVAIAFGEKDSFEKSLRALLP